MTDTIIVNSALAESEEQEDPRLAQANKLFQTGVLLMYGKRKSVEKAIKCIQKAITFNDCDYKFWQLLGEAYYQRGSLNPAINCFMRSLNQASSMTDGIDAKRRQADCTYSKLRMSDIRLSVGHLEEASVGYIDIINEESDNVAALVGLSRTRLQMARNSFSAGLVKFGHSQCMEALRFSLQAIKYCPHLCSTWKLASDCCLIQFVYGHRGNFESRIDESFPGTESESFIVDRKTCIELAQQFLCKAIGVEPFEGSGCLWHNLGISLYLKSNLSSKSTEREAILKKSLRCLLKALDNDRGSSQIRNSIAVVSFNLNLLNTAQSFLINSIQSNLSTSEVQFSNLGYMFLQKGEYRLASVAFNRCQAEEPLYSRSWLGNALLNEQSNASNLTHLRHCQKLGNNYESQLMYATKVTTLPHNEECAKDLICALDCMRRVINYDEQSLEANNTLGLLFERCNYFSQARLCFEKAYNISPQDSRVMFNKLRLHIVSNSCCNTDGSIPIPREVEFIKESEKSIGSNREYMLNFIYYLFKNEDYKSVNSKMTNFLHKLPQNDLKNKITAQVLLGLAAKAEGGDYKSWFFKNIIDLENVICIEALVNLLCLLLLGALADDERLVEEISNTLHQHLMIYISTRNVQFSTLYHSMEGYWIRLAIFYSLFSLKDQGKLIKSLVALFPTIAELWLYLGLTLAFQKTKLQSAIYCIQKASMIGSTNADLSVTCDILLAVLAPLVKFNTLDNQIKYLSRALHKCPNYGILWTTLFDKVNIERNKKFNQDNSSLFQLAIDHIIKMITY